MCHLSKFKRRKLYVWSRRTPITQKNWGTNHHTFMIWVALSAKHIFGQFFLDGPMNNQLFGSFVKGFVPHLEHLHI
jgi:hypothetical protein